MCTLIVQNSIISQDAMRITSRMALPPPLTADPVIPLWNAAEKHDLMLVREILTNSTNTSELVNRLHPLSKTTPLMAACIRRDMSHKYPDYSAFHIVELLVNCGADARRCDESMQGNTALHYAAASDQVRTAELLLRLGADPFALNNRGHAPIDITCWFEKGRVRDLLMEDIRVKQGWMYVKKSSQYRWRKRFCIVLACDSTRSVLEFKILRSPAEFNPSAVIVFRTDEVKMVELPAETGTFSKKTNLFAFEHPVAVHEHYSQESFSRRTALEEGAGKLTAFEFATDDTSERDAWLELFRGNQQALQPTLQPLLLPTRVQAEIMPGEEVNSPSEAVIVLDANIPDGRYDSMLTEQVECALCMAANRDAVCVPCGHAAGCFDCLNRHALTSKKCPTCRANVQDIMKVYL